MFWVPMLAGAAIGAIQGESKRKAEEQQNLAEAEKTRYSPWTGMHGQIKKSGANWMGGALQGGLTGAMLGQGMGGGAEAGTIVDTPVSVESEYTLPTLGSQYARKPKFGLGY